MGVTSFGWGNPVIAFKNALSTDDICPWFVEVGVVAEGVEDDNGDLNSLIGMNTSFGSSKFDIVL